MKLLRILALVSIAWLAAAATAWAGDPNGSWKFTAQGPNGRSAESTLTLKWADNQLTGSIDNRAGKAEIKDAKFANDQLSFTVVRKIRRFTITVNYAGQLTGDTIKGTIQSKDRDGNPVSVPWDAQRVK